MTSTSTAVAVARPKGTRKEGRDLKPGGASALRLGCRCSSVTNGLTGEMAPLMSQNCPLHRGLTEWPPKTETEDVE